MFEVQWTSARLHNNHNHNFDCHMHRLVAQMALTVFVGRLGVGGIIPGLPLVMLSRFANDLSDLTFVITLETIQFFFSDWWAKQ